MPHSPRPPGDSGSIPGLRRALFATSADTLLTLAALALVVMILLPLIKWLLVDAYWHGDTPSACPDRHRACWPFISSHWRLFIYGLYPEGERWRINLGCGAGALLWAAAVLPKNSRYRRAAWIALLTVFPPAAAMLFLGGSFGLTPVATNLWGGVFLSVAVVSCVFYAALVLGIVLALARQSTLPLVRALATVWIEFWRAVPALVLLFVVIILFPLFMPEGVEVDKLLRAMLAFTLILSTFLAEALRGALQSLPPGQYEASDTLGLSYLQSRLFVILPQCLSIVMPQMTSNFIGLLKETTILLIIGVHDLFGMVQASAADPQWMGPGVSATGYLFTALFFWVTCVSISRYAARLEKRMPPRSA